LIIDVSELDFFEKSEVSFILNQIQSKNWIINLSFIEKMPVISGKH
jgi:hypothetical protein